MQKWWLQSHQRDYKRHKVFGEEHSRVLKCYLWDSAGPPYSNELVGVRPTVIGCHEQVDSAHRQDNRAGPQAGVGTSMLTSWAM